ncbi:hypothetical protein KR084_001055, partial [Drosophila pseudotakahashii]
QALIRGDSIGKSSQLWKLSPILDQEGVIRMNGRINNAIAVEEGTRRPILLPKKNYVTQLILIVNQYHKKWNHQNENTIIAKLRRNYYIPHSRQAVRRAARDCKMCQIQRISAKNPQMGQLPRDRLSPFVRPFSYVGIDYIGPFLIIRGRGTEKRWICLFTCLTI